MVASTWVHSLGARSALAMRTLCGSIKHSVPFVPNNFTKKKFIITTIMIEQKTHKQTNTKKTNKKDCKKYNTYTISLGPTRTLVGTTCGHGSRAKHGSLKNVKSGTTKLHNALAGATRTWKSAPRCPDWVVPVHRPTTCFFDGAAGAANAAASCLRSDSKDAYSWIPRNQPPGVRQASGDARVVG